MDPNDRFFVHLGAQSRLLIGQISTKSAAINNDREIRYFDLAGLFFNSLSVNGEYTFKCQCGIYST